MMIDSCYYTLTIWSVLMFTGTWINVFKTLLAQMCQFSKIR